MSAFVHSLGTSVLAGLAQVPAATVDSVGLGALVDGDQVDVGRRVAVALVVVVTLAFAGIGFYLRHLSRVEEQPAEPDLDPES